MAKDEIIVTVRVITMSRKRNPIAKALRTPKYRPRVIPNKKKKTSLKHPKATKLRWLDTT